MKQNTMCYVLTVQILVKLINSCGVRKQRKCGSFCVCVKKITIWYIVASMKIFCVLMKSCGKQILETYFWIVCQWLEPRNKHSW